MVVFYVILILCFYLQLGGHRYYLSKRRIFVKLLMCFAAYELAKKRPISSFFLELYCYISTVRTCIWIFTEFCVILKSISFSIRRFQHLERVGPLPWLWHCGGGGADTPTLHQTSPPNQAGFIRRPVPLFVTSALQGKSHLCIPFLGIARPQSQFPHSCACLCAIYIFSGSVHIVPCSKSGRLILEIYKSLSQIYECRNWETEHYNSVI